ncbi:MAG: hypothetical protein A3F09_00460 [Chlamydiae bacterium RIFCSPHIGHO2_12_FULL_49_11]|nr:MAG: hypothetical protein A3F09_00460 [Chlamydiae bacterium RIFCSPHIGHO2_12_FULL_49_11]
MASREPLDICLLFGEKSGELTAKRIIDALGSRYRIATLKGSTIEEVETILPVSALSVMGGWDMVQKLPTLIRARRTLERFILERQPKIVVTIDFPDFHLGLVASLRKKGFRGKILHHVCPSIWAWRPKRKRTIVDNIDILSCVLPFEPDLFQNGPPEAVFTGYPSSESGDRTGEQNHMLLFPGSREAEVLRLLPLFDRLLDPSIVISKWICAGDATLIPLIERLLPRLSHSYQIAPPEMRFNLMKSAKFALAKLGTNNLELALHGVPTVTLYKLPWVDTFLANHIFKIHLPHYSIVNILAGRELFPEFLGPLLKPKIVAETLLRFDQDHDLREWIRRDLAYLTQKLLVTPKITLPELIAQNI